MNVHLRLQVNTLIQTDCSMQDLTYSMKSHHDKKVTLNLLSSISGFFNSGEMSALVSPAILTGLDIHRSLVLSQTAHIVSAPWTRRLALHSQQLPHFYESAPNNGDRHPVITTHPFLLPPFPNA